MAVGTGVDVAVWVGVSVGRGEAVDAGRAAGVDGEAPCPAPQADKMREINIKIELLVNILFIFIRCFVLRINDTAAPLQFSDPGRQSLEMVPAQIQFLQLAEAGKTLGQSFQTVGTQVQKAQMFQPAK